MLVMLALAMATFADNEQQLTAPTTLPGVMPENDFFLSIGGFDVWEVFRLKKTLFTTLPQAFAVPNPVAIPR